MYFFTFLILKGEIRFRLFAKFFFIDALKGLGFVTNYSLGEIFALKFRAFLCNLFTYSSVFFLPVQFINGCEACRPSRLTAVSKYNVLSPKWWNTKRQKVGRYIHLIDLVIGITSLNSYVFSDTIPISSYVKNFDFTSGYIWFVLAHFICFLQKGSNEYSIVAGDNWKVNAIMSKITCCTIHELMNWGNHWLSVPSRLHACLSANI